ncbi:hypothetical protein FACS1894216_02130 [Synergistales bacterium]|nr:hypothetical protein FACS1894216_02130 [Synergistales bacterium]
MATFTCPDCKNKVSDKAEACPKCGRKFTAEEVAGLIKTEKNAVRFGCGLLLLIGIVLYFIFGGDSPKDIQTAGTMSAESGLAELKGLGFTPTELMQKLNNFGRKNNLAVLVEDIYKTKGSESDINDVYRADISENIIMQMTTRRGKKNVDSISIIAVPKTNDESMVLMLSMGYLIGVCNPELSPDTRGKLITTLMQDKNGKLNAKQSVGAGDIKYTFTSSNVTGIAFYVENRADADSKK